MAQREPYQMTSPFVELHQFAEVTTSNDEYSIWLTWGATTAGLRVGPWRWGVDGAGDDVRRPWVEVQCRADGRPLGYDGPRAWSAALMIPLHPDEPEVPRGHPTSRVRGAVLCPGRGGLIQRIRSPTIPVRFTPA